MRKWRVYLDTSVINFLFADDAQAHQAVKYLRQSRRLEICEPLKAD